MSNEEIKRLSNELRDLNVCNLKDSNTANKLVNTPEGNSVLFSLITFSKTGILNKIIDIKGIINGKL